jgi:hypothetical protein
VFGAFFRISDTTLVSRRKLTRPRPDRSPAPM